QRSLPRARRQPTAGFRVPSLVRRRDARDLHDLPARFFEAVAEVEVERVRRDRHAPHGTGFRRGLAGQANGLSFTVDGEDGPPAAQVVESLDPADEMPTRSVGLYPVADELDG